MIQFPLVAGIGHPRQTIHFLHCLVTSMHSLTRPVLKLFQLIESESPRTDVERLQGIIKGNNESATNTLIPRSCTSCPGSGHILDVGSITFFDCTVFQLVL